jgi:hypothetical protein
VVIDERPAASSATGYSLLGGQQVTITAPVASASLGS